VVSLVLASCFTALPVRADAPATPPPPPLKPDPVKIAAAKVADFAKKGAELCAGGGVDEGLLALRAAWGQHQDADLAVILATCEIKAEDWPGAAEHLAFALRTKDDPGQRKGLEATFLDVRARVGGVKVTANIDGADVFVGDHYAGQSPLPGEVYVTPGKTRVSAKKPGYGEVEGTVDVKANGTATLALDLTGDTAAVAHHRAGASPSRAPAYVLGAFGIAGLGVGAALYAAGLSKGSAADALLVELETTGPAPCTTGTAGCATLKSLRSGHDTYVNAGTGVLAGGGALLAAGLVYGLWATFSTPPERIGVTLTPATGGGVVVGTHGSF